MTPGRKLILDLLAKSIEKVNAAEAQTLAENEKMITGTEVGKAKKRKSKDADKLLRKKRMKVSKDLQTNLGDNYKSEIKSEIKPKEEYKEIETVEIELKTDPTDSKQATINIKTEFTELETDFLDQKDEKKSLKQSRKLIREKYSEENSIKKELKDIDKKDNLMLGDNLFIKTSKSRSDNIKVKVKTELNTRKEKKQMMKSKRKLKDVEVDKSSNQNRPNKKIASGKKIKKFTPEEDKILLNVIEKYGDKINISQLSKDLKRNEKSLRTRVVKLKTGKSSQTHREYTFEEDIVILDAVLKHLDKQSLKELNLPNYDWKGIGALLGRAQVSPCLRWGCHLKPWILQHYSGTLNLDIRRMLGNYLADNFKDINSIDWPSVATKSEFAGHTEPSLRNVFFSNIFFRTKQKLNVSSEDITLEMVADFANKAFAEGARRIVDSKLTRQDAVIDYFKNYVKKNCIKNF